MFQTKFIEKIKAHILCSVTFFFFENLAIYDIMWKNTVEQGGPQMTIWHMRIACWIPKGTDTNGDRGSTVVKVLCYKSEGRWFDPS